MRQSRTGFWGSAAGQRETQCPQDGRAAAWEQPLRVLHNERRQGHQMPEGPETPQTVKGHPERKLVAPEWQFDHAHTCSHMDGATTREHCPPGLLAVLPFQVHRKLSRCVNLH